MEQKFQKFDLKDRLGEAQAAESGAGFLHIMKMVLKEIREPGVNLKIFKKKACSCSCKV